MNREKLSLIVFIALLAAIKPLAAEFKFFSPKGSFAVEVSLENAKRLRLPIYRNAITSLTCIGDYAIGGTRADKGLSPFLFAVSLSNRRLEAAQDLAKVLPGQRAIQSGFARVGKVLYAGTMPDQEGSGGHLIMAQFADKKFEVSDLGEPVKGEGIFALTAGIRRKMLYGITHPGGNFFSYNIQTGKVEVYEETAVTERQHGYYHQYSIEPEDFLSRALIVDKLGRVYGSRPVNSIFRFSPQSGNLETLKEELPYVWGRRGLGRVDSWAMAPDGTLYGGNAGDGQLIKIDPSTGKITNLGKPIMMPRLTGLAFGSNGKLYGVAGALPGYAHLFIYDPGNGGFTDLGNPRFPLNTPEIAGELAWRGFQIATVAASEDGRYILMGENESLSQLMVFPVK